MSIKKVKIENFTVFSEVEVIFTSGINVIIGENGTGKTHLMKALYSMMADENAKKMTEERFKVYWGLKTLDSDMGTVDIERTQAVATFIPAKDMLTHSKGLLEMVKKYKKEMPFDKTILDILEKAKQWKVDAIPEIGKSILPQIERIINGKVLVEDDTFYIEKEDGRKIEFAVEAEGNKKVAILWQLIMNENICEGSVLFWDEPEANINPKLLKDVAQILLELSRNGVQVFIASHNYILAKYLEVLMKESDAVAFHALYKSDNGVKCETCSNFRDLEHNAIVSSFDKLLDEVFDLNMGE